MRLTAGRLLVIALVPVVLYGAIKGVMYFNAKRAVDQMVEQASGQADIRYGGIRTEVLKAVTVEEIRVQPVGSDAEITIDRVRLHSDDPWFFITKGDWQPGRDAPPKSLGFDIGRLSMPVTEDLTATVGTRGAIAPGSPADDAPAGCDGGLQVDGPLLEAVGIERLVMDADGGYRIDETERTLYVETRFELAGIQSVEFEARLTDIDMEALAQGAPPNINLARMKTAFTVSPAFGRRALEACATGNPATPEEWSERLAEQALQGLRMVGMTLGPGLERSLRRFYREWGEVEIVASPAEPVGLLSLAFLPPDRLFDALGISVSVNDRVVTDTSFTWQQPDASALAALLGQGQQGGPADQSARAPRETRIIVRRDYEAVPVGQLARYRDHHVRIVARNDPQREGVLKAIVDGVAEVEQSLHGGKYSAFVPVGEIESVSVLIERRVEPAD